MQIGFWVKGLVAPEKDIVFNDYILVKGMPKGENAKIFFKLPKKSPDDRRDLELYYSNALENLLQIYGLVSNHHTEIQTCGTIDEISSEIPFGSSEFLTGTLTVKLNEKQRNREIPIIEKTIEKYEMFKTFLQNKDKDFLKNAIDYYNRSLRDHRLEEELIDLMIAFEYLFSAQQDELTLRYSLRATFLLSIGKEEKRPEIFEAVKNLYNKRSRVVHGTGNVHLDCQEIYVFQGFVKEAIKRIFYIDLTKDDFLKLLDQAIYDEKQYIALSTTVKEAIEKW